MENKIIEKLNKTDKEISLKIDSSQVKLTHLEKILWPNRSRDATSIISTKRDLLIYWLEHWSEVKGQLEDRPITVYRSPYGVLKEGFWQRHFDEKLPSFVKTANIWTEDKLSNQRYLAVNNLETLLWLVNHEVLEIHTWLSKIGERGKIRPIRSKENLEKSALNYPDLILFDLDPHLPTQVKTPGQGVLNADQRRPIGSSLHQVRQLLTSELDRRKMKFWTKTTGLGGLHILVPIRRTKTFEQTRALAKKIAEKLASQHPSLITASYREEDKKGKVLIDYSQNAIGKSFVALYSPRASKNFITSELTKFK